jgi:hypothetical protein
MAVVVNREALARLSEHERSVELEAWRRRKRILEAAGDWHVSTMRYPDLVTTNEVIEFLESLPCST